MEPTKIFISYSQADASALALTLYNDLHAAGVNAWIDQQDITGGKNYNEAIEQALSAANCILFIVSERSMASKYVLAEVHYAVEEEKTVIPLISFVCKLPLRLRGLQQIDFTKDYDTAFKRLLKALQIDNKPDNPGNTVSGQEKTATERNLTSPLITAAEKIFICYRVRDTAGETGRLVDELLKHFSKDQIVIDWLDLLRPGEDFKEVVVNQLKQCNVMLVIIGPVWLGNGDGTPVRIQDKNDWLRLELETALHLDLPIIPVLVDGAAMPSFDALPQSLHPLLTLRSFTINNRSWREDTEQLIKQLVTP